MRREVALVAFGFSLVVGCGDEEEQPLLFAACNEATWNGICEEITTYAETEISELQDNCGSGWSHEPCPVSGDLVGCCDEHFKVGIGRRIVCYYTGWAHSDPELQCEGTWYAGARPPKEP